MSTDQTHCLINSIELHLPLSDPSPRNLARQRSAAIDHRANQDSPGRSRLPFPLKTRHLCPARPPVASREHLSSGINFESGDRRRVEGEFKQTGDLIPESSSVSRVQSSFSFISSVCLHVHLCVRCSVTFPNLKKCFCKYLRLITKDPGSCD